MRGPTSIESRCGSEPSRADAAQRIVDRLDTLFRPFPAVGDAQLRMHHIIGDQARIIELENKAGVDNRLVFFAHGVGYRLLVLLVGR